MECPLVRVEWMDSAQPVPSWKLLADYRDDPVRPLKCVSVGWMVRADDTMKVLAPNFGDVENVHDPERTLQVCGVMRIPTCCIDRISELNELGEKQLFASPEDTKTNSVLEFRPGTEEKQPCSEASPVREGSS